MSQFAIRLSALTVCAAALVVIPAVTPAEAAGSICMSRSTGGTASTSAPPGRLVRRSRLPDTTLRPSRFARPSARASTARYGRRRLRTIPIGKLPVLKATDSGWARRTLARERRATSLSCYFRLREFRKHHLCIARQPSRSGHTSGDVKTRRQNREERPDADYRFPGPRLRGQHAEAALAHRAELARSRHGRRDGGGDGQGRRRRRDLHLGFFDVPLRRELCGRGGARPSQPDGDRQAGRSGRSGGR